MHRGYHVLAVPTWSRKVRVLLLWVSTFLFGRDIVSLESVQKPRAAFLAAIPAPRRAAEPPHVASEQPRLHDEPTEIRRAS
jgi:NADH dehydrogenase